MKSIMQKDKTKCFICGCSGYLEEHHCMSGTANRKLSEKYGLKIYLCPYHHRDNKAGVHSDKKLSDYIHMEAQTAFENMYKDLSFRDIFGRNYR